MKFLAKVFRKEYRKAEVGNFDIVFLFLYPIDENIIKFDVSMYYPFIMNKIESEKQLLHYDLNLFFFEFSVF